MSHKLLAAAVALAAFAIPATAWSFKLERPEMIKAGTFTFTGNVELASLTTADEDDNEADSSTFDLGVGVGYFVMPSLEIGLRAGYGSASDDGPAEASNFLIGAAIAYYFPWLKDNALFPYLGLTLDYASASITNDDADSEITSSGIAVRPAGGLMLAIGGRTGGFMKLDAGYLYNPVTTESKIGDISGDAETTRSGLTVGLGFGLFLR